MKYSLGPKESTPAVARNAPAITAERTHGAATPLAGDLSLVRGPCGVGDLPRSDLRAGAAGFPSCLHWHRSPALQVPEGQNLHGVSFFGRRLPGVDDLPLPRLESLDDDLLPDPLDLDRDGDRD